MYRMDGIVCDETSRVWGSVQAARHIGGVEV